jgi:hypothetical protein
VGGEEDLLNKTGREEVVEVVVVEEYEEGEKAARSITKRTVHAIEITLPALLLGTSSSSCTLYGHDRFKQTLVLCIRKKEMLMTPHFEISSATRRLRRG